MEKFVTRFFAQPDIDKAQTDLEQRINTIKPFTASLNDSQRLGLRTMAEGREGLARTISRIAITHFENLPRNENPEEMEAALAYYDKLSTLQQRVLFYSEMIDDTLTGLGADIMAMADRYVGYLQTARNGNNNLDMALSQVDDYNKRFGNRSSKPEPGNVTTTS